MFSKSRIYEELSGTFGFPRQAVYWWHMTCKGDVDFEMCMRGGGYVGNLPQTLSSENPCRTESMDLRALRSCRQVYNESWPILYNSNVFSFHASDDLTRFLYALRPRQMHTLRYLRLHHFVSLNQPYINRMKGIRCVYLSIGRSRVLSGGDGDNNDGDNSGGSNSDGDSSDGDNSAERKNNAANIDTPLAFLNYVWPSTSRLVALPSEDVQIWVQTPFTTTIVHLRSSEQRNIETVKKLRASLRDRTE